MFSLCHYSICTAQKMRVVFCVRWLIPQLALNPHPEWRFPLGNKTTGEPKKEHSKGEHSQVTLQSCDERLGLDQGQDLKCHDNCHVKEKPGLYLM